MSLAWRNVASTEMYALQHNTDRNCNAKLSRTYLHRNLTFICHNATKCTKRDLILAFGISLDLIRCSTVLNFVLIFFGSYVGICLDFNSQFLTTLSCYNLAVSLDTEVKCQTIWNQTLWARQSVFGNSLDWVTNEPTELNYVFISSGISIYTYTSLTSEVIITVRFIICEYYSHTIITENVPISKSSFHLPRKYKNENIRKHWTIIRDLLEMIVDSFILSK
jgi:hypothetical protein